jgi:hypothetical protein
MATIRSTALNYTEFFSEPANDPFGLEADEVVECIDAVYLKWWINGDAPDVGDVLDDLVSDFSRPIGGGHVRCK